MITGISVRCEVAKGTFASEYFVRIKMANGDLWEGAVDKEMVFDLDRDTNGEEYVRGRMYAYLISFDARVASVELPIEESSLGRRIAVLTQSVRRERVPA